MEIAEGQSAAQDLAILAACRDVIFGVGTFAWWGAYIATGAGLAHNDGKVTYRGADLLRTLSSSFFVGRALRFLLTIQCASGDPLRGPLPQRAEVVVVAA
jgi:hypothetical protein